jgi:hypothetical protein
MARPSKYTEEIGQAICDAVAAGLPESLAAQAAGVTTPTLRSWKQRRAQFLSALKKARAQSARERVERIRKAAAGGDEYESKVTIRTFRDGSTLKTVEKKKTPPAWTADAWWLERQMCEHFGLNRNDVKDLVRMMREMKEKQSGK